MDYKDDATAFNGLKKGTIAGKGVINNQMSNLLMQRLEKKGIPTHFVKELSERETLVKKVSIVPLEVIIRNISAGSFSKRYGVPEGIVFDAPTIEYSYKNDDLGDPLLNSYHALALKLAELAFFREETGEYPVLVTSKVLNEGVDVPAAAVGVILSGSGSVREHVQRLGRILRPSPGKDQAVLYELISADTSEENVSRRRRNHAAYRRPRHA